MSSFLGRPVRLSREHSRYYLNMIQSADAERTDVMGPTADNPPVMSEAYADAIELLRACDEEAVKHLKQKILSLTVSELPD